MKTTLDLPERLLRQTKAAAALRGQSMKAFVTAALEERCRAARRTEPAGWRTVFGKASSADVRRVDRAVDQEFSRVDHDDWR
jgi:hypothetical protein